MVLQVSQYPKNADSTPMDLLVGVVTDDTGNAGARLVTPPVGPDKAPIDAVALVLVDKDGNPKFFPDRIVTPQQFGAVSGGSALMNGIAFQAAIAYLKSIAVNDVGGTYKASPKLFIPTGFYDLDRTLDITHTLLIEGEGSGKAGGFGVILRWPVGITGFRIQRYNTSGQSTIDGVTHYGGDASILRGMRLEGAFTNMASESETHAVFAKARVTCEDIFASGWQGDGFRIGAPGGNANNSALIRCSAWYCRNGAVFDGADANAGYIEDYDFSFNRAYGFREDSHLGNTWSGGHCDSNGVAYTAADNIATVVTHNGNRYYVKFDQAAAGTNAPTGTTADNTWWAYMGAGGVAGNVIPAWFNGIAVREGGPYRVGGNPANQAMIVGIYTEGGQAYAKGYSNAMCINGSQNTPVEVGGIVQVRALNGALYTPGVFRNDRDFYSIGNNQFFGPDVAGAVDVNSHFRTGNTAYNLFFESYQGGYSLDAHFFALRGQGFYFNAVAGLKFRHNGSDVFSSASYGLNIATGKVLAVDGIQVVGPRQTGSPGVATDLASVITLANYLRAAGFAHGLIS